MSNDRIKVTEDNVVEILKELRAKCHLSQKEFAAKYGIPEGTYEQWEAGRRTPPLYIIEMMVGIFEKDAEILDYKKKFHPELYGMDVPFHAVMETVIEELDAQAADLIDSGLLEDGEGNTVQLDSTMIPVMIHAEGGDVFGAFGSDALTIYEYERVASYEIKRTVWGKYVDVYLMGALNNG